MVVKCIKIGWLCWCRGEIESRDREWLNVGRVIFIWEGCGCNYIVGYGVFLGCIIGLYYIFYSIIVF